MTVSLSGVHVLVDAPDAALIEIVLSQPHAGRSQEDGDALAALLAKGELQMVQFRSDELDATFDKITAAPGARTGRPPAARERRTRPMQAPPHRPGAALFVQALLGVGTPSRGHNSFLAWRFVRARAMSRQRDKAGALRKEARQ